MKQLLFIFFLAAFCTSAGETRFPAQPVPEEWRFVGASNGVNFYWKNDPTWDIPMIKAKNNSVSVVDYSYQYLIYSGSSLIEQGKHYFTRLKSKGENVLKLNRSYSGMTHIVIKDILIERN